MRLPFGLDLKTAVITVLFLYLVLPWLLGLIGGLRNKKA